MFTDYSQKIRTIKIIKCLSIIYEEFIIHDLIKQFTAAVQIHAWIKISHIQQYYWKSKVLLQQC